MTDVIPALASCPSGAKNTRYDPHLLGGTSWVPYVGAWTGEEDDRDIRDGVIERRDRAGIGYVDETLADRDEHGVLWCRTPSRVGVGRPLFKVTHSLRQRHAMRRLLCQICARPADRDEHGVLWLLGDYRRDWRGWPEGMGNSHPPLCLACARVSVRLCPYLRRSHVAVRTRWHPIAGVSGGLYQAGYSGPRLVRVEVLDYDDPAVCWLQASQLIRTLHECTIVELDELS